MREDLTSDRTCIAATDGVTAMPTGLVCLVLSCDFSMKFHDAGSKAALSRLSTGTLIVWGYSLRMTEVVEACRHAGSFES